MAAWMFKRVKELQAENARLKKIHAEVELEADTTKEALTKEC